MKPENFCYWLQGFFEVAQPTSLTEEQIKMIQNHLNLVFEHAIDPQATAHVADPVEAKKIQQKLNNIHDGKGLAKVEVNPLEVTYRC